MHLWLVLRKVSDTVLISLMVTSNGPIDTPWSRDVVVVVVVDRGYVYNRA